jgi:hypothetical protein
MQCHCVGIRQVLDPKLVIVQNAILDPAVSLSAVFDGEYRVRNQKE